MIKKLINFLDNHRIFLVFLILFLISIIFLGIKTYQFLNYNFVGLKCTKDVDNVYCFNNDLKIFKDAEKERKEIFNNNKKFLNELQIEYSLPDFSFYTAYYYKVVSMLNYEITGKNKEVYDFFDIYCNTYNLEDFYKNYVFYYNVFYHYKIL